MGEERVTVLIPSYNPGSYLVDALKSIFQHNYQDWKVIVVDDGSTDHSLDEAKPLLEEPGITLIRNKWNLGQSKSLNIGGHPLCCTARQRRLAAFRGP